MDSSDEIQQAITVALEGLRWCYRDQGIISGSRLVYWSWDSFFASFGACALGDFAIVHKNLELYLSLQRADGAIPKRIAHPWYWMKFIGIPIHETEKTQRPTFANSYLTGVSITQNPICLIAAANYVRTSGDYEFLQKHYQALCRIADYLRGAQGSNGLLKEGIGGGWAESVLKRGAIAFTNMCYAKGLEDLAEMAGLMKDSQGVQEYSERAEKVKTIINTVLWSERDGGYYSDWYGYQRHHHFATDGNLLAIWWNIASDEQAVKIQRKIDELDLEEDVPIKLAYDPYDFWRIHIYHHIGGIKDYHVGFSWTWLGCVDVLAKVKRGEMSAARKTLQRIAHVIAQDGTVHEIYNKGKAVHTFFYKSEQPWGWGAGLFLLACQAVGYSVKQNI